MVICLPCVVTLINLFTVTSNNDTMYSKKRIDNRNALSKLPIIVFQIISISLSMSKGLKLILTFDPFNMLQHT